MALKWHGYDFEGIIFDLLTAAYIVNPAISKEDFRVISSHFGYNNVSYDEEIYGKNKISLPDKEVVYQHAIKSEALKVLKPLVCEIKGKMNKSFIL